jgi:hypothetical protein
MAFISGFLGIGTVTGSTLVEPAGGGYARVPCTMTTLVDGAASLDAQADFGVPRTQWGTALTSWAMFDADGAQWWFGNFAAPINADAAQTNGQRVTILANAISIQFATTTP